MQLCFPWHVILTSGVAEYLFRSRDRIEKAINAGLNDKVFRADDLEFTVAARQWGECVSFGNFDLYERRFMDTASEYNFASASSLSALQLFPEATRCLPRQCHLTRCSACGKFLRAYPCSPMVLPLGPRVLRDNGVARVCAVGIVGARS